MAILDKLMEKKDLSAYISFRLEFLDSIIEEEISRLPENKREFVRQRFLGRKSELKKLLTILREDRIKNMSKKYFQYINAEFKDSDEGEIIYNDDKRNLTE